MTTSRSKFIERIFEAISRLAERNGSSAKDILNYVLKNSKTASRNLTVQVQQALRQAVTKGIVRLRGGRYKIRCTSDNNTRPSPQAKTTTNDDDKRKNSTDTRRRPKRVKHDKKTTRTDSTTKPPTRPNTGNPKKKNQPSTK